MHSLGIHNGEQLRACSQAMLLREFGKVGALYYDCARGIDLRPVEAVRIRKSIGCEHTLEGYFATLIGYYRAVSCGSGTGRASGT